MRTVLLLGLVSLLTDVSSEMIYPLLPVFLVDSLHAGPAFLGFMEGVAETIASLLKLASGRLSDRLGRRKPIVVAGYGLSAVSRPLVALATGAWHVLLVRAADRIGKGLRTAPRDALLAAASPRRGSAFGLQRAMDHAGAMTGPVVAALLLAAGLPLREVFLWAVVPGVAAVALVLVVGEQRAAPLPRPAPAPPRLRRYLGALGLLTLGSGSEAFLILKARALGFEIAALPWLWVLLHAGKSVAAWPAGRLADRIGARRLLVAAWLLRALVFLGLALSGSDRALLLLVLFAGVQAGLGEGAERALVADLCGPARGSAFGAYHLVVGIAALPAGVLFGELWHRGGEALAYGTGAALIAVAAVLLYRGRTGD